MRIQVFQLSLLIASFWCSVVKSDFILYDIDADPEAWKKVEIELAGCLQPRPGHNFDLDPDYGFQAFEGPLTSGGAGPVSRDILSAKTQMNEVGQGSPGLLAVGPSAGFGNPSNAILANFPDDAFHISYASSKKAQAGSILTLKGSGTVAISVIDEDGVIHFLGDIFVGTGKNVGILATEDQGFFSVEIYDPGGGLEGVQGLGSNWRRQRRVPEPGSAAIVSFFIAVCVGTRRRRNPATISIL